MRQRPRFAARATTAWPGVIRWAAHLRWAAQRRVARSRSDVAVVDSTPADSRTKAAADQPGPDLPLLASLVLSGLVDPADALLIALIETDQRRSR